MNAKLMINEIHGRTILPTFILFLSSAIIPIAMFLIPQGRHLFPAIYTPSYSWMWITPLVSGVYLGVSILFLELKRHAN